MHVTAARESGEMVGGHLMEGTKAFLKAVPGEVWLTETGGIVKFGSGFPGGAAGEAASRVPTSRQ